MTWRLSHTSTIGIGLLLLAAVVLLLFHLWWASGSPFDPEAAWRFHLSICRTCRAAERLAQEAERLARRPSG